MAATTQPTAAERLAMRLREQELEAHPLPLACPKCGSRNLDAGDGIHCIQCGHPTTRVKLLEDLRERTSRYIRTGQR